MRDLTIDIKHILMTLGSGPIMKASGESGAPVVEPELRTPMSPSHSASASASDSMATLTACGSGDSVQTLIGVDLSTPGNSSSGSGEHQSMV